MFQGQTVSHIPHWIAVLDGVSAVLFDLIYYLFEGGYSFHDILYPLSFALTFYSFLAGTSGLTVSMYLFQSVLVDHGLQSDLHVLQLHFFFDFLFPLFVNQGVIKAPLNTQGLFSCSDRLHTYRT
ncbi:MAG: hypothetical protein MZU95_11385 [Desulfomicrobium escambiense]|nr:hypothetical protein [Desulfomicrobium escambiense]